MSEYENHSDCNEHEHTHSHKGHSHEHSSIDSPEKMLALLEHMYQHNVSHSNELRGLIDKLDKLGKSDAAVRLDKAVSAYEEGNTLLKEVSELMR